MYLIIVDMQKGTSIVVIIVTITDFDELPSNWEEEEVTIAEVRLTLLF